MNIQRHNKKKLKELYSFLSGVNKRAYNDIYLLSNQVLSKNPFSNTLLENYLSYKSLKPLNLFILSGKFIIYYIKSVLLYGIYLINNLVFLISKQKFDLNAVKNELILIDTFFLISKIDKEKTFSDTFFPGLEKVLHKLGKTYSYVTVFDYALTPLSLFKILRLIKKENIPVLTEFQLMTGTDLLFLLYFLLTYPLHVLNFAFAIPNSSYENRLLRFELLNTIDQETFLSYGRYLQGKRISSIACSKIKFISWYENQVIDKNIYKGLRSGKTRVSIYGAQLFVYSKSIMNILLDEAEVFHDIVPDKILVNGSFYLYKDNSVNCSVGPSLRYEKLFESKISFESRENLLILLPYHIYEIENILKMLRSMKYPRKNIFIKFHPKTNKNKFKSLVPREAKVVDNNIYDLFQKTKIVMGAESGSLVEAVSLAIPAIILKHSNRFTHIPFDMEGKGIIWDAGQNVSEINALLQKFDYITENNKESLLRLANKYKTTFFCEPTEQKIIEAFDLR